MRIHRLFALFLLAAFLVLIAGNTFHFHPQGQNQANQHCKLCDLSQSFVEDAIVSDIDFRLADFGKSFIEPATPPEIQQPAVASERAPPVL